jgi:hypothetical protein
LPVCKQLQKERIDLKKTVDIVENLIQSIINVREDAENEFKRIIDGFQAVTLDNDIRYNIRIINKSIKINNIYF